MLELDKSYLAEDGAIVRIVGVDHSIYDISSALCIYVGDDQRCYFHHGRSIQDLYDWDKPSPFSPRTLVKEMEIVNSSSHLLPITEFVEQLLQGVESLRKALHILFPNK